MRVGFDATTVAFAKKTGTGVYSEELMKAYARSFPSDQVFHTYRLARAIKGQKYFLPLVESRSERHVLQDPWTFWRGGNYDVFHGLNARLPILKGAKKIVTIHDLFSLFGKFSNAKFLADQKKKTFATLNRADHIIVPAVFTKNLLIDKLEVRAQDITVVGEGVREIYLREFNREAEKLKLEKKYNILKPYFLFVGTLEKRKNVTGILEAFARFDSESPGSHQLILVGGQGFGFDDIESKILQLQLGDKVKILGHMEEEWLASLYRAAAALMFLSWEEGYGIPVIEAMACGTPVISSDTTSLPEVGAGLTHLVSPIDFPRAAQIMLNISAASLTRSGENHELSFIKYQTDQAQKYARKLTWEKVARDTRDVYSKVLKV